MRGEKKELEQATMKVGTWWFSFFFCRHRCQTCTTTTTTNKKEQQKNDKWFNMYKKNHNWKFIDIFFSCWHTHENISLDRNHLWNSHTEFSTNIHTHTHPVISSRKKQKKNAFQVNTHIHEKIHKWNDIKYLFYGLKTHISCHLVFIFYCVCLCVCIFLMCHWLC